jgi:hypothetical protein
METAAAGAMNFLRALDSPTTTAGLPLNGASQSELKSGTFSSTFFVPAQLGTWFADAVLANAEYRQDPTFTAGLTDQQLMTDLTASETSLETILTNYAYTDPTTGGKALYQVHLTPSGQAPRGNSYEQTVPLLDNAELVAGLQTAANYLLYRFNPAPGINPQDVSALAGRIDTAIGRFNFRMWFDGTNLHLGGPENPLSGSVLDRVTAEGRLAAVVAASLGDLSPAELAGVVNSLRSQSVQGVSAGGVAAQQLPYFGTALESWAVTPYLSSELATFYGSDTLYPLAAATMETSQRLGLPAAGAEGVDNGFGAYELFGLAPAEGQYSGLNDSVLIPPAAGVMAGALANAPLPQLQTVAQQAVQNFSATMTALQNANQLDPTWGVPNYLDFGSGQVNEANPERGFLEIGQMATALLNGLLGGQYVEGLLRYTPGWNTALAQYDGLLDVREAEFQPAGDGSSIPRSNASGKSVWYLSSVGQQVTYNTLVGAAGAYNLVLRYSNNDLAPGDDLTVLVNGASVGTLHTAPTGDWNTFTTTPAFSLGQLPAGSVQIGFRLATTGGYGVDLDNFELIGLPQNGVPAGWTDGDVGGPGQGGSANYDAAGGIWAVTGGGADIGGTSDQFNLLSQRLTGDGSVVVRVDAVQNTDPSAKAGAMFRASTDPAAPFAAVLATPGNGLAFEWRGSAAAQAGNVQVTGLSAPVWVQLVRAGNAFSASYSTDGTTWTQIGSAQTITMSASALAGLAVTAHNNSLLNTSTFDYLAVTPAPATHFGLALPATSTAGTPLTLTVTALDQYGNPALAYTGTVHFSSSDLQAGLPANYTFTAGDAGVHTFANAVTLKTTGAQTVTAADAVSSSVAGQASVMVSAAAATHFKIKAPASVTAGSPFSVTVTAYDAYSNVAKGYRGTVHFTSSDTGAGVVLPADYPFTAKDRGKHTFSGVVLQTPGTQTLTAADKASGAIKGTKKLKVTAAADLALGGLDPNALDAYFSEPWSKKRGAGPNQSGASAFAPDDRWLDHPVR